MSKPAPAIDAPWETDRIVGVIQLYTTFLLLRVVALNGVMTVDDLVEFFSPHVSYETLLRSLDFAVERGMITEMGTSVVWAWSEDPNEWAVTNQTPIDLDGDVHKLREG